MGTMHLCLALLLTATLSASAADIPYVQDGWAGGAVSGSTTSAQAGWAAFDWEDGNSVFLSTGVRNKQDVPRLWAQTDDGSGETGFARSGALFSTAAVVGSGTAAQVQLALHERVALRATTLLGRREGTSAAYHPATRKVYIFGGRDEDGSYSDQILEYDPVADTLFLKSSAFPTGRAWTAAAYNASANRIYIFGGVTALGTTNEIYEYNPSFNSLSLEPTDLPTPRSRMSAAFHPVQGKVYLFGGLDGGGSDLAEIVEYEGLGNSRVTKATTLSPARRESAAAYDPNTSRILVFGGSAAGTNLSEITAYDPVSDSSAAKASVLPSSCSGLSGAYNPNDKKIYLFGGTLDSGLSSQVLGYDAPADTLTVRPVVLPSSRTAASAAFADSASRFFVFGGTTAASGLDEIVEDFFATSGTYTSSVFDTGNRSSMTSLAWTPLAQVPPTVGISVAFRAGDVPAPGGSWTNGGAFVPAVNGGNLAAFAASRYVQYRATFTTTDISTSAVLDDVSLAYTLTAPSAALVSSAFDSGRDRNLLRRLGWQGTFPAGTTAQFQLRTASDGGGGFPGAWTSWLGPTGTGDSYTDAGGGGAIHPSHRDGTDDRFFQFRAVIYSTDTLSAPTLSTVTVSCNFLPAAPTVTDLRALSTTSIRLEWVDNSVNETQFRISSGTLPNPVNTGAAAATANGPGTGGVQVATIAALSPNVAYFVRLRAQNAPDGLYSDYSNEANIFALANPPSALSVNAVYLSSIAISWNANGNTSGTPYEVSLSTDGFVTNFSTPVPFTENLLATATTLFDLAAGTTYYIRAQALNGNALLSGFSATVSTPTRPNAGSGVVGTALGTSSIAWSWDSAGPSAYYRVYWMPSVTLVAITTGPAWVQTELTPNSRQGIEVEPFNLTAPAERSPPAYRYTKAAPPSALTLSAVGVSSITLTWSNSGNPALTRFEVSYTTDGATLQTPIPFADGLIAIATTFLDLEAGTSYQFWVAAQNGDLLPSDSAAQASTQTLPGGVGLPAGAVLGTSSIAWSWANAAGPATAFFRVFRDTDGAALGDVGPPAFTQTGLDPDTRYGIRVQAHDGSGTGALSPPATAYTLAFAPAGSAFAGIFVDSITVAWSVGANPSWTVFQAETSTDAANFSLAASTTGPTVTLTALRADATHYIRVRAVNGGGAATAYDVTLSTYLRGALPNPPSGLAATALAGRRIHLAWTISPSSGVVLHNLYYDNGTGVIDYDNRLAGLPVPTTFFITAPLTAWTTYHFGLRAENVRQEEENNDHVAASAMAVDAPAAVSAELRSPSGGTILTGDHVTLLAGLSRGSNAQVRAVRFQYRRKGSLPWLDVAAVESGHPNPATRDPYATHWDAGSLLPDFYELRAVARDLSDQDDFSPATVFVALNTDPAVLQLEESRAGGGTRVVKRVRVYNGAPAAVEMVDAAGDLLLRVELSSGALGEDSSFLRIDDAPPGVPVFTSSYASAGIIRDISLESGQSALLGGRRVLISLSRLDRDGDRRVDGSAVRSDNLILVSYDPADRRWRRDLDCAVAPDDGTTLRCAASHMTLFAAVSPAAPDLASVRVYPVPFKPNNADDDDGKPYRSGDPTSGILFDELPPNAHIRVFTVTGSLVWESPPDIGGGFFRWDARNGGGQDAASGVYFAVISRQSGPSVVRKLAIIR